MHFHLNNWPPIKISTVINDFLRWNNAFWLVATKSFCLVSILVRNYGSCQIADKISHKFQVVNYELKFSTIREYITFRSCLLKIKNCPCKCRNFLGLETNLFLLISITINFTKVKIDIFRFFIFILVIFICRERSCGRKHL